MTSGKDARPRRVLVAILGAGAIIGAVLLTEAAVSGPRYPAVPDQEIAAELQAAASNLGSGNLAAEAAAPTSAEVVRMSRGEAMAATSGASDNLDPNAIVYVVQLKGDFVGCMAKTPEPTSITGQALVFIFDPASAQVTDWGIEQSPIALSQLGEVSDISVSISPVPCTEKPPEE